MTTTRILAAAAAIALAGCTSLPGDPSRSTPEQLRAYAADRNANIYCATGKTAAGNVGGLSIILDKGTVPAGLTITVDPDCKTTMQMAPATARAASGP